MPATTFPPAPHHQPPPPTEENLNWAALPIVDLAKTATSEERAALAIQVRDAMRTFGFMYIINHGLTQPQNERIFDIADVPFSQMAEEEKILYSSKIEETGSYKGFKPLFEQQSHPKVLEPFLPELRAFAEHNHFKVLHPILRLLAIGLELPEETFVKMHDICATGPGFVRFMKYYPRSEEDEAKSKNVWFKGHTDIGTITILWSQPISALQIMTPDGQWRWVRHIDNALVINIGDAMEMLSGGYYKATIHRVVQPPPDQRGYERLGAFYFAMANDDVKLVPLSQSPVLQREGITRKIQDKDAPTMVQWRKGAIKSYGYVELQRKDDVIEEEVVEGITVKHYN
ncbi:Clavaminate synthase-like protein [Dichomitus squalens]|uniref:Clavaminate synthase-like protein n=1 Tax=Dichomitus squalens TaxID=114155 RepID=A0A4Q9PT35_9APHY|nr:Clavaminate synthase-like protein [Dichomitus squalens]